MPFKLGLKPPKRLLKMPALGDFLAPAKDWPIVAAAGWEYAVAPGTLEMLGNDLIGDCAPVSLAHWIQSSTANTKNPLHCTKDQVVSVYSAVTGYDPNATLLPDGSNPTDNGTVLADLITWVKANGFPCKDAAGNDQKFELLGAASLDLTSIAQIRYATYTFGGVIFGIDCRQNLMDNLANWTWDPNSPIVGGHAINGEGEGNAGGHIQSWGKNIPYTWEMMLHSLREGYAPIGRQWVDAATGKTPSGLDLAGLLAAAAQF